MLLNRRTLICAALVSFTLSLMGAPCVLHTQEQKDEMRVRYERAATLQASEHDRWLLNQRVYPHWIDGCRFWYKSETSAGHTYSLVAAKSGQVTELFDYAELVRSLNEALADDTIEVNTDDLSLRMLRVSGDPLVAEFSALTTDGQPFYAYGGVPDATGRPAIKPEAIWSPDSKRLLTAQVVAHYPTLPSARMNDSPLGGNRAWWAADGRRAYFVEIERGEQTVNVVEFDSDSGATRVVFTEMSDTYIDLAPNVYGPCSIVPLPETNQLVWYSERSGWAHLYLYELEDGHLVRQLFITLAGKTTGKDPYYREVARIGLDTGDLTILSKSDADHLLYAQNDFGLLILSFLGEDISTVSGLAPGGNYYVETVQQPDRPARTILRDRDGKEVRVIEVANTSRLPDWWCWPEPVQLKAADGKTVISGVVFRPSDFSEEQSYPVIDYIYGGPQVSNVPEGFTDNSFNIAATLAELGFIIVVIDGRGTAERSKAFHHASCGAAHTASNVEDHIAGIQQLAARYPYMDTTRVGIYGFSGGGYMAASAMLRFPDFFDVGVSGSGSHDQRLFWHTWGERYQRLLDGDNFLNQANLTYAKDFKGKMLFIHGLIDHGMHPGGLFQLTQALMNENKDFDLVLMPQAGHELPGYAMRRMWDYFVRHLAGGEPPADFRLKSSSDLMKERLKSTQ